MKSFLNKILIIAGLALIMPLFSYADLAPTITCSPAYSSDLTGKTVTFTAHISNGSGSNYDYSWVGNDGEDGSIQTLNHQYNTEGQKTISVTASSTDSSDYLTGSCSVTVYSLASLPDYTASCTPSTNRAVIGQNITWNSNISGPLAPYSIVWTGTDLNSNNINPSISYATSGSKTATMVSFQSRYGAETDTHNTKLSNITCTALVEVIDESVHNPVQLSVSGSCSASSATKDVNSTTTWNSSLEIFGGSAPYQISWTDDEGNIGVGTSVSKVYSTIGTKTAYLTVQDNASQEVDLQCGSISIIATSTDTGGNTGGSTHSQRSTGGTGTIGTTTGGTTGTLGFGSSTQNTLGSTTAGVSGITPISLTGNVLNPNNSSSPLATASNGTSSAGIAGSSTESGINLAAAAASASGSATKYAWYIAGIVLLALIGWLAYFLIKRNKKDKIS